MLPEKWTAMGTDEQLRAAAEPLDGPAIAWARASRARARDRPRRRIDRRAHRRTREARQHLRACRRRAASCRRVYRKLHMFDVEVGGHSYRESDPRGRLAMRSSLSSSRRRRRAGDVDLLRRALPGALPDPRRCAARACSSCRRRSRSPTTRDHWETLLRARAIENQAFVIAANQVGLHPAAIVRAGAR